MMRIACECVVVEVLRVAVEVRRLVDHPVKVRRLAVEVRRLTDRAADVCCVAVESRRLAVEVRRLVDHPVKVRRLAVEVRRLAVEVRRLADHPVEVCRLSGHPVEMRRLADHPVEVCRLTGRAMESRHLAVESRRLAEHLADFAVDLGSSCLYSLGTASMYCFFLFAFTRQLESPLTCHQIVSNGSLQANSLQSSAAATPNGRVRIGEDGGVPERKVHTQFPR